jgi:hypothetical protein
MVKVVLHVLVEANAVQERFHPWSQLDIHRLT